MNNKGITLIALIITIIVLLILSGVAINVLTGNNSIIENANKTVEKYNNSVNKIEEDLNDIKNTIGEYSKEKIITTEVIDIPIENMMFGIKATINLDDILNDNINYIECRYAYLEDNEPIGIDSEEYVKIELTSRNFIIKEAKAPGTYYLHVLLIDGNRCAKEIISEKSINVANDIGFTANDNEIKLLPGTYQLEVWGAKRRRYWRI